MNTTIKTWCPTPGPQVAFMVTHDEAISIPDYYTVKEGDNVVYRPTCHYAYHPCEDAISSCFGILGKA
jgi:homospermidine synthase